MISSVLLNAFKIDDEDANISVVTSYCDHILPWIDGEIMKTIIEIDDSYSNHEGFKHWFWYYMSLGQYTYSQLKQYALMYYQHVRVFRLFLSGAITVIYDDELLQKALSETIADEYGISLYGENLNKKGHPELYRDFMISLNLTEKDWGKTWENNKYVIDGIKHYKEIHYSLFRGDLKYEMIGAVIFGMERTTPYRHSNIVKGIRIFEENNNLNKNTINTQFFEGHIELDPFHNLNLIKPIIQWFKNPIIVNRMKNGAKISFDARKEFLDDLAKNMNVPKSI